MSDFDLYTPLAYQVPRVRGVGITRGEMIIVGTDTKPCFHVVLRAEASLWDRIMTAPNFTYPDDAVDALAAIVRPIMPLVTQRQIFLTPNEGMMIGLANAEELRLAGIRNVDGTYTVPDAMLWDTEMCERMANPQTPNQYWAATLNKFEAYDPDNPDHITGVSVVILPEHTPTASEVGRAVTLTDPGWNWTATMDAETYSQVAAQLKRNLLYADPLGA